MPAKNEDLHGNAPDKSSIALLLIDVINDFEFEEGDLLLDNALPAAENIASLKKRAKQAGIPVIYVNDNYGKWQSDFLKLVTHAVSEGVRGKPFVEQLLPEEDDYFVVKPKHSGFYSTVLDTLLDYFGAETLIIAGLAGNSCVLFTSNDAYMRDFYLHVPSDCVASNHTEDNETALHIIRNVLKADTRPQSALHFTVKDGKVTIE
ncbi:cysteine hydrolase family protein [Aneurinibacillus tyrosinisolvens]|uniref:cysteine hydrolase family protein n=1 Tax=Aneurinibacillus tyrosinisolvens TaxID=1443435 RepID=UPI00063EDCBF|nr:isochorismatase family cysteine hydrolase [Aneurinibacillus tyrosinisolvens]